MKRCAFVYVLIERQTDLPLLVADTHQEVLRYLGCKLSSKAVIWHLMHGTRHHGLGAIFSLEKVRIPSDEEIEEWFLTKESDCAIMREMNLPGVDNSPNYTKFVFCIIGRIAIPRARDVYAPLLWWMFLAFQRGIGASGHNRLNTIEAFFVLL